MGNCLNSDSPSQHQNVQQHQQMVNGKPITQARSNQNQDQAPPPQRLANRQEQNQNQQIQQQQTNSQQAAPPEQAKYSWQKKKKDLSNFQFMKEQEKFLYRTPNSLGGQMFRIQECIECNLYVHDHHNQCFIDKCINCVIVMGPCSSSTFIRDCSNCKLVITCQQLRMRDCENVEVMLYSQTEPIIESSKNITFTCHNYAYDELLEQMKAAKLSFWNNKWTNIFDFTPNRENQNTTNQYGFVSSLKEIKTIVDQLEEIKEEKIESLKQIQDVDLEMIQLDNIDLEDALSIPHTLGTQEKKYNFRCFIMAFMEQFDSLYSQQGITILHQLQTEIVRGDCCWVQETRSTDLDLTQIKELLAENPKDNQVIYKIEKIKNVKKMTVGIDLRIDKQSNEYEADIEKNLIQLLKAFQNELAFTFTTDMRCADQQAKLLFRTFNIEHTGHNIAQ